MAVWVNCRWCHGSGSNTVWNAKKRTYEKVTCNACKGKGGDNV